VVVVTFNPSDEAILTCDIEETGEPAVCGDAVKAPTEACDDGNLAAGDGCTSTCSIEPGFQCTGSPSTCATTCGDGVVAGGEACDDAPPAESGDGCSSTCQTEPGFICTGQPSICSPEP
jgi:cysteine-rich repeat protein